MNRKKLGIFFIRYQAVIILFYEFLILTIFYLITKFKFQNNNSLIMISLMLIVPIVFKIGTILIRKKNRIKYNTNHTNYYELILKDLKTNKLTKELLQKTNLNYKIEINNNNIIITLSNNLLLTFQKEYTTLQILDTQIIYNFYYSFKTTEITKYDFKGISSYSTERFYFLILKVINNLINKELVYKEYYLGKKYNGCSLTYLNEDIYKIILNTKKRLLVRNKTKSKHLEIK